MTEELTQGAASPGAETPTPPPAPAQEPPAEPTPQYLTRDEALSLVQDALTQQRQAYEIAARELGARGAQSFVDKQRLAERLKTVEATINQMVGDGLIDQSQASAYRERARLEALTDLLPEAPEPQPAERQTADPVQQRAEQLLNESGLTPQDPEYHTLYGHADPFAWFEALAQAKATKAARLARTQAQAAARPAPAPASVPPGGTPTTPPAAPSGAAAVEVGAGGGTAVTDMATLRKQMQDAARRGDMAAFNTISAAIDRAMQGGA
jgi:hypothetical protein